MYSKERNDATVTSNAFQTVGPGKPIRFPFIHRGRSVAMRMQISGHSIGIRSFDWP